MATFWNIVNSVIRKSDLILVVIDARFPEESLNREIINKIENQKKRYIIVVNKSDLVPAEKRDAIRLKHKYVAYVSATKNLGTTNLRHLIYKAVAKRPVFIGVIGYPNTGKSSLINALAQRASAKTSPKPGLTRALQKIKVSHNIYVFDTPGVLPYREKSEKKHALMATLDPGKVQDPEDVALEILGILQKKNPESIKNAYGIAPKDDPEETLEEIGKKLNWLRKGGGVNTDEVARRIIRDWQRGILAL